MLFSMVLTFNYDWLISLIVPLKTHEDTVPADRYYIRRFAIVG
jgi:hypothetical protein